MSNYLPFVIAIVVISLLLLGYSLRWFGRKERDEKRQLDVEIMALETQLEYKLTLPAFEKWLAKARGRQFRHKDKYSNIITGYKEAGHFTIFDYQHLATEKNNQIIRQSGILIQSEGRSFPEFEIVSHSPWNWVNGKTISRKKLPIWLLNHAAVLARPALQDEVCQIVAKNNALWHLLIQADFQKMIFYDNCITIFFNEEYEASLAGFELLTRRIDEIINIKDIRSIEEATYDFEIKFISR